jgi:hypothetical protein
MVSIEISTGPRFSTFSVEHGAVLDIIPLAPGGTGSRGLLVASGNATTARKIEPGRYLFQVDLPSGESLTKEVLLTDDQSQPVKIELFSKQSPHEWLSWQQLNADLTQAATRQPVRTMLADYDLPARGQAVIEGINQATVEVTVDLDRRNIDAFAPVTQFIRTGAVPGELQDAAIDQEVVGWDEQFGLYGWFRDSATAPECEVPLFARKFKRYYALVEHETGLRELICLPIPWTQEHHQCGIQLLVSRHPGLRGPRARVTVQDTALGAMLTFLSRDSMPSAQAFVDPILNGDRWEEVLYFKKSNPLAAAGAGYILLQNDPDPSSPKKWYEWIENLYNFFPWCPDGAVLLALLRMAHRTEDDGSAGVIECVDQAMSRGVPFYRLGLRQLYELIAMFREAEGMPDDIRERMGSYQQLLVPLMQAVNPTEPFVSFRTLAYRKH